MFYVYQYNEYGLPIYEDCFPTIAEARAEAQKIAAGMDPGDSVQIQIRVSIPTDTPEARDEAAGWAEARAMIDAGINP